MVRFNAGRLVSVAGFSIALLGASACGEAPPPTAGNFGGTDTANAGAAAPNSSPKVTPNPSASSPPSRAFAQFERLEAGRFRSTQQFTVFNPAAIPGSVDSIQFNYVYADGRFADVHQYDTDVTLQITKFSSPERAQAFLANAVAKSVPAAQAGSVRLPACRGEKSAGDDFVGPSKLVRTMPSPRGGEITILHSGDFNMYDCSRGSNRSESAIWVIGEYYFLASASPMARRPDDTGYGRAQDLAVDYMAALGS